MATIPIVNTFDKRAGMITSIASMVVLLIVLFFLTYQRATPLPEDIPITVAAPLDVTEIEHVVVDLGGGGSGSPSENDPGNPNQIEQVIATTNDSDYESTLEATHHGPYLEKPVLFVELGIFKPQNLVSISFVSKYTFDSASI